MIELRDFSIGYGDRRLYDHVDATFSDGQLTAFIGRNGTGKSTLLRAIAGLNPHYEGEILLDGRDIRKMRPGELAKTIAFVTTERTRIANLRCEDVVAIGRAPYTNWIGRMQPSDREIVEKSLEGGYANQENLLVTIRAAKKNRFSCKTEYTSRFSQGSEATVMVMGQQYKTTVKKGKGKQIYFVPKQELALKNAVTGTVDLVLKEKKNVLYVPSALVFDMGSKKVVYIEGKEGVKETREVTTGEQIQNEIEITGGLKENEQILTN